MQDLAVLAGKDQPGFRPGRPPGQPLLQLPDPVPSERGAGERVEGELPRLVAVLASATTTGRWSMTTTVWTTASRPGDAS
jgi:hypothetical protein